MNFGNEYKKAVQDISPDRAAIDRMKASVMAEVKERKKPLPLGKIAVSCGSVAACAAVIITAAVLIPHNDESNMTAGEPASAPSMAEIAVDSSAADFDNGEAFDNDIAEDTAADVTEDCFDADKSYNNAVDNAADTIITPSVTGNDAASRSDDILEEVAADETETAVPNDDSAMNPAAGDGATSNDFYDDTADNKIADNEIGTDGIYDAPDADIMDDENFDFDDSDDGIDTPDNEIANDCDDDIYDEIDDCDDDITNDEDSLPPVEKAKFSVDKSELRLIMEDGSRLDFIIDSSVDVPVNTPLEKFTDSSGTEYYLQCSGIYLVLYDAEGNFIAVYRVN